MADQYDIKAVLHDAIDTGAMLASSRPRIDALDGSYAKFRAQFRAALAELPSDAMVCEVLEVMDRGG